jgi:hypothetical protein
MFSDLRDHFGKKIQGLFFLWGEDELPKHVRLGKDRATDRGGYIAAMGEKIGSREEKSAPRVRSLDFFWIFCSVDR